MLIEINNIFTFMKSNHLFFVVLVFTEAKKKKKNFVKFVNVA